MKTEAIERCIERTSAVNAAGHNVAALARVELAVLKKAMEGIRESISWFAQEMERKLQEHDDVDCDPNGWDQYHCDLEFLEGRLHQEVSELEALFPEENTVEIDRENAPDPNKVISEAADIANFAMMIADRARSRLK